MSKEFIFDSDNLITFCAAFNQISVDSLTDSLLEINLQDMNERWTAVQSSYKAYCMDTDTSSDEGAFESTRGKYTTCLTNFQNCKEKILDLQKSLVTPSVSHAVTTNNDSVHANAFIGMKVPPCDVEIFQGGYEQWPAFRESFTALYVDNPRVPQVQKLFYLRSKVRGPALGVIKHFTLCGDNFLLAWNALKSRYENKRTLVDNQLKLLFGLNPIGSESSDALHEMKMKINDCLAVLEAQSVSTKDWDPILVYMCTTRLPHETLSLWEQSLKSQRELPMWKDMNAFLSNRLEVVERLNRIQAGKANVRRRQELEVNMFSTEGTPQFPCKLCAEVHGLKGCSKFLGMDPKCRNDFVFQNKMCLNCLSQTHIRKDCTSKFTCMKCKKNHNTLLHYPNTPRTSSGNALATLTSSTEELSHESLNVAPYSINRENPDQVSQVNSHFTADRTAKRYENTILPTAIVQIKHLEDVFPVRAFLDQGSEKSFISKALQQKLRLPTENKSFQIRGIGGHIVANSNSLCSFTLFSENHDKELDVQAIVVPKITRLLPNFSIPKSQLRMNDINELNLADPHFYSPRQVDILLGSNVIPRLLLEGVKSVCDSLIAQATIFGWVISGPVATEVVSSFSISTTAISNEALERQLRVFWEQEEVPTIRPISKEDEYCETLYEKTTFRNPDGRYVVKLPFKQNFPHELRLGPSRPSALMQYIRMERTLTNKPDLANTYHHVLSEYLTLKHMEPTMSQEVLSKDTYKSFYLPHHAVMRPESHTTKVRVVFNASKSTPSGKSLNDILHVGPTLQTDLMTILLNWRLYRYVFSGDIEKMYRQILVNQDDSQFQRILFRPTPVSPILDYALKTITFGVNCAPYLAIRTILKLARDSEETHPQASKILQRDTYVDDVLSGTHDISSGIDSLHQLIDLLKSAGFPLRKITSNCSQILESVPQEIVLASEFLKLEEKSTTRTLGIQWNALSDHFSYRIDPLKTTQSITKRQILSAVSKLFDPAGWISPVVIQGKILLQHLWLEGTNWDENVKPSTLLKWNMFIQNLSHIPSIKIPRWIRFAPLFSTQVHGFCDASERAYSAAVYLRIQDGETTHCHLLVSKSKVAPINPVSLPRLELCGAVLLSKLMKRIISSLPIHNYDLFFWCDSSIVLSWLGKPPTTWKTYVANRTAQIIGNLGNCTWRHVRSHDNPADLGSRGCSPQDLSDSSLWWSGPSWLKDQPEEWPKSIVTMEDPPEMRKVNVFHSVEEKEDILDRFSEWDKAIRVISYLLRYHDRIFDSNLKYSSKSITQREFIKTRNRLISLTQQRFYHREFQSLKTSKGVHKRSPLYCLNPFIDSNDVIRINGRLTNSGLPYHESHPIVLPVRSRYCTLFISYTHNLFIHAEQKLLVRTIREEYFVSRLKAAVRKYIRSCKTCVLYKRKTQTQIMASLPFDRSTFTLPFTVTGLDFAGPFSIKASILRQATYHKGYVCVFVCFSTKAIHLELCTELTSSSFLAAFTRFVSRRGLPRKVMSDNGTNFVGGERILRYEFDQFLKQTSTDVAKKYMAHGFDWMFIPPNAPHMGGLWEAGVKSFKTHFHKVAQNYKFTFEEFSTLLTRIESVLNSRPLSPMTDDHHDLLALTPGHFLRGAPLIAIPEEPIQESLPYKDRWAKLKYIQHQFARRWKDEYLMELHQRYKWPQKKLDIEEGQLVAIKDDQLPPCEWRLGRVRKMYLGQDGHVRVADVRTQLGTVTRAIASLCILPCENSKNPASQEKTPPSLMQ